mmetsp:Transcript_1323/g.1930  ORF Transcript_1323/g.1930 Transcript_1323/m.1930 type:complete len:437 (-) Transcript_1323:67-1377(-)
MSKALSLKCNTCGLQLKSVAEAQSHGETSGHSDFAESTEAVLNLQCVACGKPCRSDTEKDLHTKRTGHAEFQDKTNETAKAVDTEVEMKQLDAEMKAELGLPVKEAVVEDKGTGEAMDTDEPEEMITPEVDEAVVTELEGMGFVRNRAVRALYATGTTSVEQAVSWMVDHAEDADIDDALMIKKSAVKVKLTKEEAKAKYEALTKSVAAKNAKDEKELQRLQEQERIRSGKELLKAKKMEEDLQLKRNMDSRRIEKAEVARAKARIQEKLAEDKRARRLKLGLPEELTDEEKARERARAEEKAAAARELAEKKAAAGLIVKPVGAIDALRKILVDIKKSNAGNEEGVATCFKTFLAYLGNVMRDPEEEKFRVIKLSNGAYVKRIAAVNGGVYLEQIGFVNDGETLTLPRDKVDKVLFNLAGGEISSAITNPFFGVL